MLTEPDGVTVTDESTLSVAVAPASVYTEPCATVIGFVPVTVITGAVLSNVTELESVVDDTEAPAFPAVSENDDIENGTTPSVSVPNIVYVAVHAFPTAVAVTAWVAIVTVGVVMVSDEVNVRVTVSPVFAFAVLALFDAMWIGDKVGVTES